MAVGCAQTGALAEVRERYRDYSLTVRAVSVEKVGKRLAYLGRLFGFLGPPETAAELFARLVPETIDAFLADCAPRHGPGSRRDMRAALRPFLHFAWARERIGFPGCKGGPAIGQHLTLEAGNRLADWLLDGRPQSPCREVFLDLRTGAPLAHSRELSRIVRRRLGEAGLRLPPGVSRGTHGSRHAFAALAAYLAARQTCEAIGRYLQQRDRAGVGSGRLFLNARGQALTRFGIGRRVAELAREAAACCPSLRDRTVTPHLWRHTTALHMIEAGIDIVLLRDWLGHVDIATTKAYLHVDLARKRQALGKFPPPAGGEPPQPPRWKQPATMEFLVGLSRRVMWPENRPGNRKPGYRTASRNITAGAT